jgi:hypothetical protein
VLIEIGLFQGDELLQRVRIKVTEFEQFDKNDQISVKHQLVENAALIELCVFDNGVQQIKSNLEIVVVKSFWPRFCGHSNTAFRLHWVPLHRCEYAA